MPFEVTEETLRDFFEEVGKIDELRVFSGKDGKSRGMGTCTFEAPKMAEAAVRVLRDRNVGGRPIWVIEDGVDNGKDRGQKGGVPSGPAGYAMVPLGMNPMAMHGAHGHFGTHGHPGFAPMEMGYGGGYGPVAGVGIPTHLMHQFTPYPGGGSKGGGDRGGRRGSVHSADVERELDRWEEAKRSKDFATSDDIRKKLRSRGVDADVERGHKREQQPKGNSAHIEDELDRWEDAKRNRDFAQSDAIRDRLRSIGVDADVERGHKRDKPRARGHVAEVERELDRWEEAKRNKDFATSDAIRNQLRSQGIDADVERGHKRVR